MTTIEMYLITPLKEMISTVVSFVPTLVSVAIILLLGYLLVKLLHEVLHRFFKMMRLDKITDMIELSKMLRTGGVKHSFSHVLTSVVGLIFVLMFVILALRVVGIDAAPDLIGVMVVYVTHVLTAVFVLVIGLILAQVVGKVVHMIGANLDLPKPKLHERVARWAIILFTIKMTLSELGFGYLFSGTEFHIWFAGVVLALALAFGLGGRDAAAKYLASRK